MGADLKNVKLVFTLLLNSLIVLATTVTDAKEDTKNVSPSIQEGGRSMVPFSSTLTAFESLGNVHSLTPDDRIIRGAVPNSSVDLLLKERVTDVLSLQPSDHPQWQKELTILEESGFLKKQIHNVSMYWDRPTPFKEQCIQYLKVLRILKEVKQDRSRKIYFHCTMGEDRTGLVAGLYRIIFDKWSFEKVVAGELCAHGYAFSNLSKPKAVAKKIQDNLGVSFIEMVDLVEQDRLSFANLDDKICDAEPNIKPAVVAKRLKLMRCPNMRQSPK